MSELTTCGHCDARYNPNGEWVYGTYTAGTTGNFTVYGKIPKGDCPVCRKPQEARTKESE